MNDASKVWVLLLSVLVGCGAPAPVVQDGGSDDAGAVFDDAGADDAGTEDAGPGDAGVVNAPGSVDTSFGVGGRVSMAVGLGDARGGMVRQQADGKILQAGSCADGARQVFCVVRYDAAGQLDPTFGTGGKVMAPAPGPGTSVLVWDFALQTDGKLVLTGMCGTPAWNLCVSRFLVDGTPDSSFDGDGTVIIPTAADQVQRPSLVVQADGGLLIGASYATALSDIEVFLVRLLSNGSLDAGFGAAGTGIVKADHGDRSKHYASALVLQADGKILWVGNRFLNSTTRFFIERYTVGGTVDPSFGTAGSVMTQILSGSSWTTAAIVPSGDQPFLGGYCATEPATTERFCALRLTRDGASDPGFGALGKVAHDLGDFRLTGLARQGDGKLLGLGSNFADGVASSAVVRFLADGSVDQTFGPGGKRLVEGGGSLVVQADGKLLVGGICQPVGAPQQFCLTRLNP